MHHVFKLNDLVTVKVSVHECVMMDRLRGGTEECLMVMCDMLDPSAFWDINTLPCGGLSHTGICS